MREKEKAIEIVAKFVKFVDSEIAGEDGFEFCKDTQLDNAKHCATIAVTEMLKVISTGSYNESFYKGVLNEIEKL